MLHAPPVSLLPWCPCRAFFAARLPLLKRPVPPWLAPRHRRVLRRCYLVSSPIITSDVAPSFAASSTHLRCVVTAAACFYSCSGGHPSSTDPIAPLPHSAISARPCGLLSMPFFIFTSRPPSPSRDRGSPPCVSRRPRRLALRPCAAILISSRLSFLLFPEGAGERFRVGKGGNRGSTSRNANWTAQNDLRCACKGASAGACC